MTATPTENDQAGTTQPAKLPGLLLLFILMVGLPVLGERLGALVGRQVLAALTASHPLFADKLT